jgi:O-methyltransferase
MDPTQLIKDGRAQARRWREERRLSQVARSVKEERLTYLQPNRLLALEQLAARVDREGVRGDFVECGVALGGSTVVLATAMNSSRSLHAFDVFGMIPPPTAQDPPEIHERYATIVSGKSTGIGDDPYYGYREDLLEHVSATLARYGHPVGEHVHLYKGLFEDTLHLTSPVALAHIDCDWHDPVSVCLERIGGQLSPGGLMVLDDYTDHGGCQTATDDYLAGHPDMSLVQLASNAAVRRAA